MYRHHQEIIKTRFASLTDGQVIYDWEFHPTTRKWMVNSNHVSLEEHLSWLEKFLRLKNSYLLICELEQGPKVAVVRADLENENHNIEIGITVDPNLRNKGLGKACLISAMNFIACQISRPNLFIAKVKKENLISTKLFEGLGFVQAQESSDFAVYERRP